MIFYTIPRTFNHTRTNCGPNQNLAKPILMLFPKMNIHHLIITIWLCFLFAWFGFNLYHGERTFAGEGIAWDASVYAQMSKTNPAEFFKGSLGQYHFQRVLPATIVYYLSQIFCLPMENNQQIIFAWYLYLLGIRTIAFSFFWLIAKHFEWSLPVR